jgi:hypothetical protein
MGGITQTLTGAAMIENYEERRKSFQEQLIEDFHPRWIEHATRGDLRFAFTHTEIKFDSLHHHIDTKFLEIDRCFVGIDQRFVDLERQFGKAARLHQIEFVMIMLGFLGIILNLR